MIFICKKFSTTFMLIIFLFLQCVLLPHNLAWSQNPSVSKKEEIRYIPIGDSYTIGTGAPKESAWPEVLVRLLQKKGINIKLLTNPSYPGWSTVEALKRELPIFEASNVNFATLMIGTNDYYRGDSPENFRVHLEELMDQMLRKLNDPQRLIVITTPDFSVTPIGAEFHPERNVSEEIQSVNTIIKQEAQKRNLTVVDIFKLSQEMGKDKTLVSPDQLHPSAKEHALWAKEIFPIVYSRLRK